MSKVDVHQWVNQLHSSELAEAAAAFRENVERLSTLNSLPFILVGLGHAEIHRALIALEVLRPPGVAEKYLKDDASKADVHREIQRRLTEKPRLDGVMDEAIEVFKKIFERPDLEQARKTLIISNVANAWTALESVARDAWVAALNSHAAALGQRAFERIS